MKRDSSIRWLRRAGLATVLLASVAVSGASAQQSCRTEDFGAVVDQAGVALRKFNLEENPKLQAKLKQLSEKNGWPASSYEEQALDHLQDDKIAALDNEANDLLTEVDALSRPEVAQSGDCAKLDKLRQTTQQLQQVMRTKTQYTIEKIDGELQPSVATVPPAATPVPPSPPKSKPKDVASNTPRPAPALPPMAPRERWTTTTSPEEPPRRAENPGTPYMLPPDDMITDERGYTIDEIREASRGLFGTISTSLASVIEHAFATSGRPTAYVLGNEGGGAFLAGLRYGKGTLYMRAGGSQPIYWHGPSLGGDIGAEGARTLYLIYGLKRPDDLYRRFAGVDGSAYFVGGFGVTFLKGGSVIMAPIRSGLGFRLGASIGFVRFTAQATWNPF